MFSVLSKLVRSIGISLALLLGYGCAQSAVAQGINLGNGVKGLLPGGNGGLGINTEGLSGCPLFSGGSVTINTANCESISGGITGSGATTYIPLWLGNKSQGNSPLSVTEGVINSTDILNAAADANSSSPTQQTSTINNVREVARSVCEWKTGATCGDGIHDDTATINAAFAALATTGGTLVFPPGVFLTSTGITPSQTSTACVNVDGAGSSVTTIRATAAMNGVWWRPGLVSLGTQDQSWCHVKGITFDGNNLAYVGMNNAGWPRGKYEDLHFINAIPNTTDNTNAQFIIGSNESIGLSNGQGDDYEDSFAHIQVLASGPTATAPYQMYTKQTVSDDGGGDDIVIWGHYSGSAGSPDNTLVSGLYIDGGEDRSWSNVHCYPSSQYAPFPTCITDAAGYQTFYSIEADGMTNYGINFQAVSSIVYGLKMVYGGTGTPDNDYTSSYAVNSVTYAAYTNSVYGLNCQSYGGAVLTNWRPYSASSGAVIFNGSSAEQNCALGSTTGTIIASSSNSYLLNAFTANTYVQVGTWVANGDGDTLQIHFNGGAAYGSADNTQGETDLVVGIGSSATGVTNINGIAAWSFGTTGIIEAFAIGTGNTNTTSWNIWVLVPAYSPLAYTVTPSSPLDTWTNTNTTTSATAPEGTYEVSAFANLVQNAAGVVQGSGYALNNTPVTINRDVIHSGYVGTLGNSQEFGIFANDASTTISIPTGCNNSRAYSLTAATAATTLTMYTCAEGLSSCTSFGTIAFAASGTAGTFTCASAAAIPQAGGFYIQGPATADATLGNIAVALYGTHN